MAARFGLTMLATTPRGEAYTFAEFAEMHDDAAVGSEDPA
jgi:hypothetical protein